MKKIIFIVVFAVSFIYAGLYLYKVNKGRMEDSVNFGLEGRDLCERTGLYSWKGGACAGLADTYFEMKEYEKAKECYAEAKGSWQKVHMWPSWTRWASMGMARCGIVLGEKDVNLESLRAISGPSR